MGGEGGLGFQMTGDYRLKFSKVLSDIRDFTNLYHFYTPVDDIIQFLTTLGNEVFNLPWKLQTFSPDGLIFFEEHPLEI